MSTNESDDWPFDNEIQFCQFVQVLYVDEPILVQWPDENFWGNPDIGYIWVFI